MNLDDLQPGDVMAVATHGWAGWLIRLGERLHGLPGRDNHIVVVHHRDDKGVVWGIEGRPGGVGWVDVRGYLGPATVTNAAQPKSDVQRQAVADALVQMLGTAYDFVGIAADACRDLDFPELFAQNWHGKGVPGHVVCSSLAAFVYQRVGLAHPDGGRFCQPDDWTVFIEKQGWK